MTTTYTHDEILAHRAEWVEALRSGEYAQGQAVLESNGKFCCLGVACDLMWRKGLLERGVSSTNLVQYGSEGFRSKSVAPREVVRYLGLLDVVGSIPGGNGNPSSLTAANDVTGWSFGRIANLIESGGLPLIASGDTDD